MQNWSEVEAYNDGLRAILRGDALDLCPYPLSSPRYEVWQQGWADGARLAGDRSTRPGQPSRVKPT